ncbi:MAG TPA: tetratricopeptide repeat protein, partial [Thermoanaerobaculia bacterium]|nr:tetratricopeptide repeat protein [Thermoanaerobaculia bacterium]
PAQSEYQNLDAQLVRRYRDAEVVYGKARARFDKKDFEGTRKELDACLKLIPAHAEAHLLLAKVLYVDKDFAQALVEVERAKAGHDATAAIMAKIQADRMSELRKRAREKDNSIAERNAQAAKVPGSLALQQPSTQVDYEKDEINRILNAQRPDPSGIPAEYFFFHGNVLLRLQRPAEAVAQYEEALKINPAYGEAANNLAALYFSARQYEKARGVATTAEGNGVVVNPELKKAIESALQQPR